MPLFQVAHCSTSNVVVVVVVVFVVVVVVVFVVTVNFGVRGTPQLDKRFVVFKTN